MGQMNPRDDGCPACRPDSHLKVSGTLQRLYEVFRRLNRTCFAPGLYCLKGLGQVRWAVQELLHRFAGGLHAVSTKGRLLLLLALTLPIWLLEIALMFVAFQAFSLPLPLVAAMVSVVLLCVAMMIPAAPGFIGTCQFFVVTGLQLYHVAESQALAIAVFLNLFVFTVSTLLGVLALGVEAVGWLRRDSPAQ